LPSEHRWRYRQEFLAELYGMTPTEQRHHAAGVLSRVGTLRLALTDPDRLAGKEATMTKPFLCRIGRHRWRRLRNPEGGWYRECRSCGIQRYGLGGDVGGVGGHSTGGPA
jgi:hypothetical protein